jgi:ELWxxDGT repeat protein
MRLVPMPSALLLLALVAAPAGAQAPYLVRDVAPGIEDGVARGVIPADDRVFFIGPGPGGSSTIWTSEGTAATTAPTALPPSWNGVVPVGHFAIGRDLMFGSEDATKGLWRTDGTPGGARFVAPVSLEGIWPVIVRGDGRVLFGGDDGYPFVTDGTETGTFMVPPPVGAQPTPFSKFEPIPAAGFADGFAVAMAQSEGIWWTSHLDVTTRLVADEACSGAARAGGRLFLLCEGKLIVADGTSNGQVQVTALADAPLVGLEDVVIFLDAFGKLWRSDGTAAGTFQFPIPDPAPSSVLLEYAVVSDGVLYFGGVTFTYGRELWRTDGTAAGTFMVKNIGPGPGWGLGDFGPGWAAAVPGGLLFVANDGTGDELWKTDGTEAGTVPLARIAPSNENADASDLFVSGSRVLLRAQDGVHGYELWAVDLSPGAAAVADTRVAEGDSTTAVARFAVRLQSASAAPVVVGYSTVAGTAAAGLDFQPRSGTLTFAPGTRELVVDVPVVGDQTDEGNEWFRLQLTSSGGSVLADRSGVALILDDDDPSFQLAGVTMSEGSADQDALVPVTLVIEGPPTASAVTVLYFPSSGTASAGDDFDPRHGVLTFPAGSPSGTTLLARITVHGDVIDEPDETFSVQLDGPEHAGMPPTTVTVVDDDEIDSARPVELSHGSAIRAHLAPPVGRMVDRDFYVLRQRPRSSYEMLVDEVSGDATPLAVLRIASNGMNVEQEAVPVGTGTSLSLRWETTSAIPDATEHLIVQAPCVAPCGPDDTYRVRLYETTLTAPRFNNVNGQGTVVLVQNATDAAISGSLLLWLPSGALGHAAPFDLPARGTTAIDTLALLPASGTITVTHDGPYGGLVGKAVSLEPATGFSFDTPLTNRPR